MITRIGWSADFHLGYRQYGLFRRERDFELAAHDLVNVVVQRRLNALLVAGDILNNNRPSPLAMACLRKLHEQLVINGIPMYVIPGNHDASDPHWITACIDDGSANTQGGIKLLSWNMAMVNDVRVFGIPSLARKEFIENRSRIPEAEIIMFHQLVQEFANFPADYQLKLDDMPLEKAPFWAGGDIHKRELRKVGNATIGYPGSIELNSKSEEDDKTFFTLTYDGRELKDIVATPIVTRPVLRFKCRTDAEVDLALETAKRHEGDRKPIVFLDYLLKDTHNVQDRMQAALDPNQYVLQPMGFAEVGTGEIAILSGTPEKAMSPQEFLKHHIKAAPDVELAVSQLLAMDCNPDATIAEWVDKQLAVA